MNRALLQAKAPPFNILPPPPSSFTGVPSENRISPSILLIIIILAIIFFVSGLLHLLVRCLLRPPNREPEELDGATALQGQLQQLFHLHDSGVDQSFIDALPVFLYKAIIGVKDPFDCAVCLCEFEPDDKLRLLPKCSHAFHLDCIDTWLLSHSTCPLCRGSLLPDFSSNNSCSPVVLVLESACESSRDIAADVGSACGGAGVAPQLDALGEEEGKSEARKSAEIEAREEAGAGEPPPAPEKVVAVKLGKFRNVGETSSRIDGSVSATSHVDGRRCFSMGSYEYVMDDSSSLQVPIRPPAKKTASQRPPPLPLTPGHRPAMSVCDCHSSRGFSGFGRTISGHGAGGKRESFSVSKIWLRGGRRETAAAGETSRRAASFRLVDEAKTKGGPSRVAWDAAGTSAELAGDDVGSCHSFRSSARAPSFARRTIIWLAGRQNRVVHSSASSQV